jgi:polyphosphate kinase 2 (PPK2 family)
LHEFVIFMSNFYVREHIECVKRRSSTAQTSGTKKRYERYKNSEKIIINHKIKIKPSDLSLSEIERLYLFC